MPITIYDSSFMLITILAIISYFLPNEKQSKLFFVVSSITILFLLQGMRDPIVGIDTITYGYNFKIMDKQPLSYIFSSQYEPGYQLLNFFINKLGFSFQFLLSLISLFNLTIYGIIIYQKSVSPYLSIIMYIILGIYDFGFSGLRQALAMSIVLISLKYLLNNNAIKFVITILIAGLFHQTALLFLIIYPLVNTKLNKIYKTFYIFLMLIIILLGGFIDSALSDIFYTVVGSQSYGLNELLILAIFILSVILMRTYKYLRTNKLYQTLLVITSFSVLLQLLSIHSYNYIRLNLYYYQFITLIFPMVVEYITKGIEKQKREDYFYTKSLIIGTISIVALLAIFMIYQSNPHGINPHYFWWDN